VVRERPEAKEATEATIVTSSRHVGPALVRFRGGRPCVERREAMAVSVLSGFKSDAARRWRRPGTATGPAVALTVPHFRIGSCACELGAGAASARRNAGKAEIRPRIHKIGCMLSAPTPVVQTSAGTSHNRNYSYS
jgi:hypothetical protein